MASRLVGVLLVALLLGVTADEASEAQERFNEIDTDHSGAISRAEFQKYLSGEHPANAFVEGLQLSGGPNSFLPSFMHSFVMIIVTELGDKTFFIAAILAMSNDRWAVFLGAAGALIIMTVLSVGIGFALPNLLPKVYTHYAAAALFAYFGVKLLKDASGMEGGVSEELAEVEEELAASGGVEAAPSPVSIDLEAGVSSPLIMKVTGPGGGEGADGGAADGDHSLSQGVIGRKSHHMDDSAAKGKGAKKSQRGWFAVLTQCFTLTFLAEWGDRSQIATIAMSAAKDPYGVAIGGFIGHALCTALAVLGGRFLATRISERTVSVVGGVLFLVFALHSLFVGPDPEGGVPAAAGAGATTV